MGGKALGAEKKTKKKHLKATRKELAEGAADVVEDEAPAVKKQKPEDLDAEIHTQTFWIDAAMRPKKVDNEELKKLAAGGRHEVAVLKNLKRIPNPSELLTHITATMTPGRWSISLQGPNCDKVKCVIQVHLKDSGGFYITTLAKKGAAQVAEFDLEPNGQNACQFKFGDDINESCSKAKAIALWENAN